MSTSSYDWNKMIDAIDASGQWSSNVYGERFTVIAKSPYQMEACISDDDCPTGYSCENGVCVKTPCTCNDECPEGYECVDPITTSDVVEPDTQPRCEKIVTPECTEDSHCPDGYECIDGQCVEIEIIVP